MLVVRFWYENSLFAVFHPTWTYILVPKGLSDCQQITLIRLHKFCLISENCPLTPLFLKCNIKMDRRPTKTKRNLSVPFALYFNDKNLLRYSHQILYFLMFLVAFKSADIIFHKFLELDSILSDKSIFVTNFRFLTYSLKPLIAPPP